MPIELHPVKSSQIHAIGYDAETKTLAVQFLSKGKPGAVYHYFDVKPEVYAAFEASDSKGKYFSQWIKRAGYKFERVAEPPAAETKVVMDTRNGWPFPKVGE